MVHFMQNGGPSQMDLFDPKPELRKRAGQSIPESVEIYQKGNSDKILASPFRFLLLDEPSSGLDRGEQECDRQPRDAPHSTVGGAEARPRQGHAGGVNLRGRHQQPHPDCHAHPSASREGRREQ